MKWNEPTVGNGRPMARKPALTGKRKASSAEADPEAFDRLMTLEDVGEQLGKTMQGVRMMIYRGELEGVRIGKRGIRVKASSLKAFIDELPPA